MSPTHPNRPATGNIDVETVAGFGEEWAASREGEPYWAACGRQR